MKRIIFLMIFVVLLSSIFTINLSSNKNAKVLIVTYSMTEKTKAVSKEIAKRFKSDLVYIKAEEYDGVSGGISANSDAWTEETITKIKPEKVDMSQYDLIFLGSPIWWYRPAVPLWTFVEKNNFKGKKVVLFNTFNSKFKKEYIDKFKALLKKKGATFVDHIYVKRGRWISQLSDEELLEEFNKKLNKKMKLYKKAISN